ncbi:MAG: LacI family transcriptional regulator [Acidiferrobacterales bacterium]|nr:LacI family transcriptional regulator [Acidiferrobacterales bacterium]
MKQPESSIKGIRQIAAKAGVSIATVSRVLNGSEKVADSTRDRVMAAVSQTNYRPNAAAKALATNRTRTIAALIPTLEHSIFAVFIHAIEDEVARAGYSLVIATHGFDDNTEAERCNEVIKLGAEAIIVSGAEHSEDFFRLIDTYAVPCLYTSVYEPENSRASIGYDNRKLGSEAILFLQSLGHSRIAVIHGPIEQNDRMRLRVAGVKDVQQRDLNTRISFFQAPIGVEGGALVARKWFEQDHLPEACLCLTDTHALGVMFESQRHQIRIPEELSVMGFEDLDWAEHCEPGLTTIALPAADMGKIAGAALVRHLDNGEPLAHQLLQASIVERGSTSRRDKA